MLLRNQLASDQENERVVVFLDEVEIGEIALDRARQAGELRLVLSRTLHRYRFAGETTVDGQEFRIEGAGVIVTTDRMDELAERSASALEAVAAYRALLAELRAAAPAQRLADLELSAGRTADDAALAAAEKRLGIRLPAGYKELMRRLGSFTLGRRDSPSAAVYGPDELATVLDHYLTALREDGDDESDLREIARRIARRFPASRRDVVLDSFEWDEPTVLVAGKRCAGEQVAIALPGSDFDLLGVDDRDNPLLGVIDYDYIMGEPQCHAYDRLLAYSLHDQLLEAARPVLYLLAPDERAVTLHREDTDERQRRIWLRFIEAEE